ncbi:coa transferase caib/baif family protein [Camelimonas fluminis]|uniref:CoA transferase n=1 Tax=Camelimonas fluminis TaxID=1576911 RepID=A0ABV7UMA7_9HYPH|nr:CoA transferase [Camelimonas fluminis]GHE57787.1 coa transferase caib/baif family protein [Camelimonas fluminis]
MSQETAMPMTEEIWSALGGQPLTSGRLTFTGAGELPSAFAVSDLAAASVAAAGLALSDLQARITGQAPETIADRRLASLWFGWSLAPRGWRLPPAWDDWSGDYRCADGWIRVHANAPAHRNAALRVLGQPTDRNEAAQRIARLDGDMLETAIIDAGGCAARMRQASEWRTHAQGASVAREPLIAWEGWSNPGRAGQGGDHWRPTRERPLQGLRVLDLTRVLAGPASTRFLAACGACVLRIDPPDWDEPAVIPEVTSGKMCARMDLRLPGDRDRFVALLQDADVLVHGYRPGALAGLDLGAETRRTANPGLVEVSLDAWGWSGPWRGRRGFDSLVQMSSGIAAAGMAWKGAETPTPLPVQALDHATGWLMAAAVLRGLVRRLDAGGCVARLSLARTAALLVAAAPPREAGWLPAAPADYAPEEELTDWGPALRLRQPLSVAGVSLQWASPARRLGSDAPRWPAG